MAFELSACTLDSIASVKMFKIIFLDVPRVQRS